MHWASRRRLIYALGVFLFFAITVGIPISVWLYQAPNCFDGSQNQGETAIDKGGPCSILDERTLQPHAILWARAFLVRGGAYSALAYIENPNREAGVRGVGYRFGLYDERNVLVAERTGVAYILPGGITPIFEGAIQAGSRTVARTHFSFTSSFTWERMQNAGSVLSIRNTALTDAESMPRLRAQVENTSVAAVLQPSFVAVVFDPAGNAFAASATTLSRLEGGEKEQIVFTWPDAFTRLSGRIDILPLLPPIRSVE